MSSDSVGLRSSAASTALALVVITLAGCGGSSATRTTPTGTAATTTTGTAATTPTGTPTTTTTTQAPAPAANKAADQRVAQDAQLRPTDFPAGWKESAQVERTLPTDCQAINGAKAATSAQGRSRTFSERTDQAQSAVYMYADTASASHWFAELSSSGTRSCLGGAVGKQLAKNASGTRLKVGAITTGGLTVEQVGDERAGARVTIPLSEGGATVHTRADYVFVRVNRGVAIIGLVGVVRPFDQALAGKLVRAVVDRLGAGLK